MKIRSMIKEALIKMGDYSEPDFLIIGAQKAGSTFLYSVLRQHPDVIEPAHKEAQFFNRDEQFYRGKLEYFRNFDLAHRFKSNQITFEATPDYLSSKVAPQRIFSYYPKIKMIVLLRDPIERAISGWKMHHYLFHNHPKYSNQYDPRSFDEVVQSAVNGNTDVWDEMNHIGKSLYGKQLANFLGYFTIEQFLILFQRDLKTKQQETINRITRFLGIKNFDLSLINKSDDRFWDNESKEIDLNLSEETRTILANYYKPDQELLEQIIEQPINW